VKNILLLAHGSRELLMHQQGTRFYLRLLPLLAGGRSEIIVCVEPFFGLNEL
jgi:hypothetical protein